jgi:hypothetical protein
MAGGRSHGDGALDAVALARQPAAVVAIRVPCPAKVIERPPGPLLRGVQQFTQPLRERFGVIARRPFVGGEAAVIAWKDDGFQAQ